MKTHPLALSLAREIQSPTANTCLSPLSIQLALSLAYLGARHETAKELQKVLDFHPNPQEHAANIKGLMESLKGLDIANRLYGPIKQASRSDTMFFLPEYLKLTQQLGADVAAADFENPAQAAAQINRWVESVTHNKIQDLIQPQTISPALSTILVNAIYFKQTWLCPFSTDSTQPKPFILADGRQENVPTMHQTTRMRFLETPEATAVALAAESNYQMTFILPNPASDGLPSEKLLEAMLSAPETKVALSLPKFTFSSPSLNLTQSLQCLGITHAFSLQTADFSGISEIPLCLSQVVHKTFVEVNEIGVEAAAATTLLMIRSASFEQPKTVTFDRPFFFAIQHVPTQTCLFFGKVNNPLKA